MGKVLQAITGSTKRIVGIMAHDFQRVFTNPVAAIIAVGVMVLPSLYAWFNIQASWDPYGSTDHISVAVSNVDEGTVVQGMELNVGKSIVESLAENEQIGWKFVNKEKAHRISSVQRSSIMSMRRRMPLHQRLPIRVSELSSRWSIKHLFQKV